MSRYAIHARDLILSARWGVLATASQSMEGHPFGSLTPYDVDARGDIVIYVSHLAEHFRNLRHDPRGSLTVAGYPVARDVQAAPRATVLLTFSPVPDTELSSVNASYRRRFPQSEDYELTHDFVYLRGTPLRIRWIGGFGEIGWVRGEDYAAADADPLAYASGDIVDHMNDDHRSALAELVNASLGVNNAAPVEMVGVTQHICRIVVGSGPSQKLLEIPFKAPAPTPEDVRIQIIKLLREARGEARNE
jgi:heme iron utilization protein